MGDKRLKKNRGRVDQNDWLVVDVEIVRHEGEFPAEIGVQAKLMSDFEVEQFCFDCVELARLRSMSGVEALRSFLLTQSACDRRDRTAVYAA